MPSGNASVARSCDRHNERSAKTLVSRVVLKMGRGGCYNRRFITSNHCPQGDARSGKRRGRSTSYRGLYHIQGWTNPHSGLVEDRLSASHFKVEDSKNTQRGKVRMTSVDPPSVRSLLYHDDCGIGMAHRYSKL